MILCPHEIRRPFPTHQYLLYPKEWTMSTQCPNEFMLTWLTSWIGFTEKVRFD